VSHPARWITLALVVAFLAGCSTGGFIPGGPHALPAGQLEGIARSAASANAVDPKLVLAVIDAESHGDPAAISRVGAEGLMQLMPSTAAEYGVANPFDPTANVAGGARYLHDLLHRYKGNVRLALAAYNAGPGAVDAAHGVPHFAETRAYVDRIIASLR
jgi:soluble lytic murein transglycosylase-like protein